MLKDRRQTDRLNLVVSAPSTPVPVSATNSEFGINPPRHDDPLLPILTILALLRMRRGIIFIAWIFQVHLIHFSISFQQHGISLSAPTSTTKLCMVAPFVDDEQTVVIIYHKPPNIVTSHSNNDAAPAASGENARRTVYEDILSLDGYVGGKDGSFEEVTGIQSKLHAIGRLDADTSGVLLLTNDGGLVHHVTNPAANDHSDACITKTYKAVIMGNYETNSIGFQSIREEGVDIGAKYGGMTQPAKNLVVLGYPTAKSTLVSITIAEGKNRQVRRMFHAIRSGVMKLKRTHIGSNLNLEGLAEGEWRLLTDDEVKEGLAWRPRKVIPASRANIGSPSLRRGTNSRTHPRQKNARNKK